MDAPAPAVESADAHIGLPFDQRKRLLASTSDDDIWNENAWDEAVPGPEHEALAEAAIAKQRDAPVSDDNAAAFNSAPASYWNALYSNTGDTMYKDRSWLCAEFPELADVMRSDAGPKIVVELGSGPGNTAYPLLASSSNPDLHVQALDFSAAAISLVKSNPVFDSAHLSAIVWDLADPSGPPSTISDGSVDVVIAIFVLSALHPDQWSIAARNIHRMLKRGGSLLFRDYGRNDLVQLRFKRERYMQENLYVRGDGTRVHFFDLEQVASIFGASGDQPSYEVVQLGFDRRLLLNRKRKLQMWRVWLQGRFRKL